MDIQTVTITISDLEKSKKFYEELLGFEQGPYYDPTHWQAYTFNNQLFGIREKPGFKRAASLDITNFETDNIEGLWAKVQGQAKVVEKLAPTPWGSYRFVIEDPDGYQLGFVAKKTPS